MDSFLNTCRELDSLDIQNDSDVRNEDQLIAKAKSQAALFIHDSSKVSDLLEHENEGVRYWMAAMCIDNWVYLEAAVAELRKISLNGSNGLSYGSRAGLIIYLWDNDRVFLKESIQGKQD